MSEPDFTSPEYIKKQFYQFARAADFDRMGPWLTIILKNKEDIDIPLKHLKDAFEAVIIYRLNEDKVEEALTYYVRSFGVDGIDDERRLKYAQLLSDFLQEQEDQLVWSDYQEIVKHLRQQVKYLEVYSGNKSLIAELNIIEARLRFKQKHSEQREEGPMREYISSLMNLYYQHLPDEEACDYASQIILNSGK